jgi:hypothetical protein
MELRAEYPTLKWRLKLYRTWITSERGTADRGNVPPIV